jgi:putative hemolysin
MSKKTRFLSCVILAALVLSAYAMKNPSTVYCQALGYTYEIKQNAKGEDIGVCLFPENENADCSSWDFMQGKCGTDYSYCAKMGYRQKTATGTECGSEDPLAECLICILPDGKTAEVSSLMDLDAREGVCGDGACVMGENHESCPADCPGTTTMPLDASTMPAEDTTLMPMTTAPPGTSTPVGSTTLPVDETNSSSDARATTVPVILCGNGICDKSESSGSCPADCRGKDGLSGYLPYAGIAVILLLALFEVKKKLDEKSIEKKREEFKKWKQEKEGIKQ